MFASVTDGTIRPAPASGNGNHERQRYTFRVTPPEAGWLALKDAHAALLRAAGAERFILDRLCLDDDPPLRCEVERVREALGRVADL